MERKTFKEQQSELLNSPSFVQAITLVAERLFPDNADQQSAYVAQSMLLGHPEGVPAPNMAQILNLLMQRGGQIIPNYKGAPLPEAGDLWVSVDSANVLQASGWVAKVDVEGKFFQGPRAGAEPPSRWEIGEPEENRISYFVRPYCQSCASKNAMRLQPGQTPPGKIRVPADGNRA